MKKRSTQFYIIICLCCAAAAITSGLLLPQPSFAVLFVLWCVGVAGLTSAFLMILRIINLLEKYQIENSSLAARIEIQRHAENENSLLAATVEAISDALIALDNEGNVLFCNQKLEEMWDIDVNMRDNLRHFCIADHIKPQLIDPTFVVECVGNLEAQSEMEINANLELLDGRIIEWRSRPRKIGDRVTGRVCIYRDITERILADERGVIMRRLLEASLGGVCFYDADWNIVETNPAMDSMFGYESGELNGQKYNILNADGNNYHSYCDEIIAAIERDNSWSGETQNARKNGSLFTAFTRIYKLGATGKYHYGSIWHDITEQKQTEKELRHNEASLITAQQIAKLGSWDLNTISDEIRFSDELYNIFEVKKDAPKIMRKALFEAVHPDDRDLVVNAYRSAFKNKSDYSIKFRIFTPDGQCKYVYGQGKVVCDEYKCVVMTTGIVQDITERVNLENELAGERRLAQAILNNSGALIVVFDIQGRILRFNKAAEVVGGLTFEEVEGKTLWETVLPPDGADFVKHNLFLSRLEQSENDIQICQTDWINRKTGERRRINWWNTFLNDADRNIIASVGVDMTEFYQMQGQLQHNEAQYRRLIDNIHDGLIIDDVDGFITFANNQFIEMFGFDRYDSGRMHIQDIFYDDYREEALLRHQRRIAGLLPSQVFDFQGKRKDGSTLWVEAVTVPIHDATGKIIGTQSTIRNVSDRKIAENERERYRLSLENTSAITQTGGWEYIVATGDLFLTQQARHILGIFEDRQTYLENIQNYTSAEDYQRLMHLLNNSIINNTEWSEELPLTTQDGRSIIVRLVCKVESVDGKVIRAWGAIQDITPIREAERALQESERNHRLVIDAVPDAIIIVDASGNIMHANQSILDVFGYEQHEIIGKSVEILMPLRSRQKHVALREEYFANARTQTMGAHQDVFALHNSGREFPVNITLTPIIMNDMRLTLAIVRDITEQKAWEKHVMRAQRMDSIGTLASGIAHDLNNILTPILIGLPILGVEIGNERSRNMLKMIEDNTKRAIELVKRVLSFGRGMEGERIALDLRHIIKEMRTIIGETFPKNIQLQINIPKHPLLITGDATQLHQVMLNLCVNSRDAMPDGGMIYIGAEMFDADKSYIVRHPDMKAGKYVQLKISDQGAGMSPNIIERIFEPFFTTKEHGKGTGLGIPTVVAIVKSHGGFLEVYSEVNQGTIFNLYFPALDVSVADSNSVKKSVDAPDKSPGARLLVVDDEPNIREAMSILLETCGYSVITAASGVKAVEYYEKNSDNVNVVITDINMPGMDGFTLIRILQAMNPNVKVIATSGLKHDVKLGPSVQFLTKPFSNDAMLLAIQATLAS